MKLTRQAMTTLALTAALVAATTALHAAPTAAEIEQLGKTLTPIGAEKAGNKDGTIPAWEGGICKPPAGYKPINPKGGYPYVDPFASDKVLFTINAKNMAQYADKLSRGTMELLTRYPDTYRLEVYPTRRSACFPEWAYENTMKNAGRPKLESGGLGVSGAHAQFPFPIPKNGYEVMWNALLNFYGPYEKGEYHIYLTDSSGARVVINSGISNSQHLYWDDKRPANDSDPYSTLLTIQYAPAWADGIGFMKQGWARADIRNPMAWSYVPGQRRVRLAPEFKYDSVGAGGMILYDEINAFDGKMDKFDFKLIGKKEIYTQYNNYKLGVSMDDKISMPHHPNPDVQRWELHRMWVVEATLKPGERHTEKKKIFYIDEDSWIIALYDGIDQQDKPYHHISYDFVQEYEKPMMRGGVYQLYDFSKTAWEWNHPMDKVGTGVYWVDSYPPNFFTPGGMTGAGVR